MYNRELETRQSAMALHNAIHKSLAARRMSEVAAKKKARRDLKSK